MAKITVWAPRASRVELLVRGERLPLSGPDDLGYFGLDTAAVGPGTDYAFVLDGGDLGGKPLPDPRSPWQPAGVHGPSRWVDHAAFPWTDGAWEPPPLCDAVLYELHTGTFSPEGTFDGAAARLGHLCDLGVTHVSLMPVAAFAGERGWGYDGVGLFAPHEPYGGPDGLKRLVDACHGHGLAVVLDVVYNHLGPEGNYTAPFAPYFTDRYRTPWGEAVNLDGPHSDEVRRWICDSAACWLRDYHVDGLRLDAVHAIVDTSARHILEQLSEEVDALSRELGRRKVLIAESDLNDPRVVTPRSAGGLGMDAQWSDDFHHALHTALTGERQGYYADFRGLPDVADALTRAYVYRGQRSAHRQRSHGREPVGLGGTRFCGYLQTHDQVGNRAVGERATHLMSTGRLKVGAALVLTAPFVPMLFQGEEWGASTPFLYFTDHKDEALGRAVAEGRPREFESFGWDPATIPNPQRRDTFEKSKLDWDEARTRTHTEVLAWYRDLIALRRAEPALRDGRLDRVDVSYQPDQQWMAVTRSRTITVAVNLAPCPRSLPLPPVAGAPELLLASDPGIRVEGAAAVELPPDSAAVLRHGSGR